MPKVIKMPPLCDQCVTLCNIVGANANMSIPYQNIYLISAPTKLHKAEATQTLKPRGDVTRNPKQGYQWP